MSLFNNISCSIRLCCLLLNRDESAFTVAREKSGVRRPPPRPKTPKIYHITNTLEAPAAPPSSWGPGQSAPAARLDPPVPLNKCLLLSLLTGQRLNFWGKGCDYILDRWINIQRSNNQYSTNYFVIYVSVLFFMFILRKLVELLK